MTQNAWTSWLGGFSYFYGDASFCWRWGNYGRAIRVVLVNIILWMLLIRLPLVAIIALWEYVVFPILRWVGPILLRALVVIGVMWLIWKNEGLQSVVAIMFTLWILGAFVPALKPLGNAVLITPLFWVWSGRWQMPRLPQQRQNQNRNP